MGASGTVDEGVPVASVDQPLVPAEFVADTRTVYTVPLAKFPEVGMVSVVPVEVACRVEPKVCAPDFHCTV